VAVSLLLAAVNALTAALLYMGVGSGCSSQLCTDLFLVVWLDVYARWLSWYHAWRFMKLMI
jgi:hypothetical protein